MMEDVVAWLHGLERGSLLEDHGTVSDHSLGYGSSSTGRPSASTNIQTQLLFLTTMAHLQPCLQTQLTAFWSQYAF